MRKEKVKETVIEIFKELKESDLVLERSVRLGFHYALGSSDETTIKIPCKEMNFDQEDIQ